jgi:hypothetical protein
MNITLDPNIQIDPNIQRMIQESEKAEQAKKAVKKAPTEKITLDPGIAKLIGEGEKAREASKGKLTLEHRLITTGLSPLSSASISSNTASDTASGSDITPDTEGEDDYSPEEDALCLDLDTPKSPVKRTEEAEDDDYSPEEDALCLDFGSTPTPVKGKASIISSRLTKEQHIAEILKELEKLEPAVMQKFISKFDIDDRNSSTLKALNKLHADSEISMKPAGEGMNQASIVMVNGKPTYILKKVALDKSYLNNNWSAVQTAFNAAGVVNSSVESQVTTLFVENPTYLLPQVDSHFANAQREKLVYILGKGFGVPRIQTLQTKEGTYSLHEFAHNEGSVDMYDLTKVKFNVQSVQDIGVLDILVQNQDRINKENILVSTKKIKGESVLIPIDHSLSYQNKHFRSRIFQEQPLDPCWTKWEVADRPLSDLTKAKIMDLNAEELLTNAKKSGLVISKWVSESFTKNVAFLQKQVKANTEITLNEVWNNFFDEDSSPLSETLAPASKGLKSASFQG